jgi:glycosyl transferase family 11
MITFQRLGHHGRLGNQMFEYAALVAAATRLGVDWGIDFAKEQSAKVYSTRGRFRIKSGKIRETLELRSVFEIACKQAAAHRFEYREPHFHFDPGFLSIQDATDILGYFQSPKYFEDCADLIRREFTFKKSIQEAAESFLPESPAKQLVSLHIRRGDYVYQARRNRFVDLWSSGYYQRAMAHFSGDYQFLCFSDDAAWCRQNLPSTVVCVDSGSQHVDLCLLSRCHHNIIANSTFSWWGAWLNANPEKKVVCPTHWFGSAYGDHDTKDLYCERWIRA